MCQEWAVRQQQFYSVILYFQYTLCKVRLQDKGWEGYTITTKSTHATGVFHCLIYLQGCCLLLYSKHIRDVCVCCFFSATSRAHTHTRFVSRLVIVVRVCCNFFLRKHTHTHALSNTHTRTTVKCGKTQCKYTPRRTERQAPQMYELAAT